MGRSWKRKADVKDKEEKKKEEQEKVKVGKKIQGATMKGFGIYPFSIFPLKTLNFPDKNKKVSAGKNGKKENKKNSWDLSPNFIIAMKEDEKEGNPAKIDMPGIP